MKTRIVIVITKLGVVAKYQQRVRRFRCLPWLTCWKTVRATVPHADVAGLYKDLAAFLAPCWTNFEVSTSPRSERRRIARNWASQVTRKLA
jgi:hypothetical protein